MHIIHIQTIHTIHTDTYRYIQIHTIRKHLYNTQHIHAIHTHTYTYIHCKISVNEGFWRGAASASDPVGRHHLPRSPWTGLQAGPTCLICPQDAYSPGQRCALTPPDACFESRCAKIGQGQGLRIPAKWYGHMPKGVLSPALLVPPLQAAFWGLGRVLTENLGHTYI